MAPQGEYNGAVNRGGNMAEKTEATCCPKFNPKPWDEKNIKWEGKHFIQDEVKQFMHMPLPGQMDKVIKRMDKAAREAGAAVPVEDFLLLAYDPSPWKSEMYMAVTKEVPDAKNVRLTGNYISKVFDGDYNEVPIWIKEFEQYLGNLGEKAKKYYFYYTICPKCAKKYGHNYVVAIAEV
jgi:predicted nucleic-acid-binding Zn-ribbon protein